MAEKAKRHASAAPEEGTVAGCRKTVMRTLAIVLIFLFAIFLMRWGVFDSLLGLNRPPTVNITSMLMHIQLVSELTTVRHAYNNVITVQRDLPPLLDALYRDRLVLVAVGYVTAGVDLSKLSAEDVQVDDSENIVRVAMPPPELFDCFFSEPDSYIASRDTGIFTAPAADLDLDARQFAIRYFRNAALESGILTEAAGHVEEVMANLLGAFLPDYTVIVTVREVEEQIVMPPTCGGGTS
jgi:hypothetical protein